MYRCHARVELLLNVFAMAGARNWWRLARRGSVSTTRFERRNRWKGFENKAWSRYPKRAVNGGGDIGEGSIECVGSKTKKMPIGRVKD